MGWHGSGWKENITLCGRVAGATYLDAIVQRAWVGGAGVAGSGFPHAQQLDLLPRRQAGRGGGGQGERGTIEVRERGERGMREKREGHN